MHVSIKVVAGALLFLAFLGATLCAVIPTIASLQDDVRGFVASAAESAADQVQFVFAERLHTVQVFGNALYKAARTHDLLHDLQPWSFIEWAGAMTVAQDLSIVLARTDDRGILLAPYNTMNFIGGVPIPGYVRVSNYTLPGSYVDSGFFSYTTFQPYNQTQPWVRTSMSVKFSQQKYAAQLANPNRSTPMVWLSLTPRVASQQLVASVIIYGGPVTINSAVDPGNRHQLLSLRIRGEALGKFFVTTGVSPTGIALLIDAATSYFVAGSISDPTGRFVNGSGQLINISQLQDPRIAPIIRASSSSASSFSSRLLTCPPPCSFTYWPHSGVLLEDGTGSVGILDILLYQFTAVRVVQVSAVIGGALDLRLVATVPSRDVIGTLVSSLQWSLFRPIVAMLGVCIVVIVAVALVFRELTVVEKDILQMANVFEGHPITAKQDAREEDSSRESGASQTRRRLIPVVFKEISAITAAVNTLTRELYTLKAFTTIGCNPPLISTGDTTTIASEVSSQPISRFTEDGGGIPYQFLGDQMWRVPVTTVYGALARDLVDPDDDPVAVYKIHNAVLTTIQKYALKFTGASVDHFFGDHFLVHFNASARTPKHVLVGLSVVVETVKELKATFVSNTKKLTATVTTAGPLAAEPNSPAPTTPTATPNAKPKRSNKAPLPSRRRRPIVCFGVASCLSQCGMMGPPCMRVFTVVSQGESQAAAVSRIAMTMELPMLLTWRVVEVARNELDVLKADPRLASVVTCKFRVVSKVLLPGDSTTEPTNAYTIDTTNRGPSQQIVVTRKNQ